MRKISIHALVKRATIGGAGIIKDRLHFNPRPREEGDLSVKVSSQISNYFNPRPREEGDPTEGYMLEVDDNFNPRPREEGDRQRLTYMYPMSLFQSTPS